MSSKKRAKNISEIRQKLKSSFLINEPFEWNTQQKEILSNMSNDLIKCVVLDCLAGTGKTIMSVFSALHALQTGKTQKIYYIRSAVESANTKLQALPGSWEDKISVYGGPLLDSLRKLITEEEINALTKAKSIEVMPISFLRGRSLDNCIIIVDEAQNMTMHEIITIITRLEKNSKIFVIADSDQSDLPKYIRGEFKDFINLFNNQESISHGIVYFEMKDENNVMRSPLVKYVSTVYRSYRKLKD